MPPRNVRLVARNIGGVALALSLLSGLFAGGCLGLPPANEPTREHWVPGYGFGIWGKGELDVRDDCPAGAARVRIGATWSTLLVSVATLGIYTPHEVIVHCRARP